MTTTPARTGTTEDRRRSRWDAHKLERRRHILQAAVAVVEAQPPGTDIHVQQIADEAGLARSVIYRHFADRSDLDHSLQQHVLDGLRELLDPALDLGASIDDTILRIIETYVTWSSGHPNLHRLITEPRSGDDIQAFRASIGFLADQVSALIKLATHVLGVTMDEPLREFLDPMVFGIVGAVIEGVRRWLDRPEPRLPAAVAARMLADTAWYVIDGHARRIGVVLDKDRPLEEVMAARLGNV